MSNIAVFAATDHIGDEIEPEPQAIPRALTHGTFEIVEGVATYWVRLHGPTGPLVPVRGKAKP